MADFISNASRRQFVVDQLNLYAGVKKSITGGTFVSCPFHAENTPSGRIFHGEDSRSPGAFRCYGCGAKASWDELAPKLGLQPFKRLRPQDEYLNLSLVPVEAPEEPANSAFILEDMIFTELPTGKTWRSIKTSLLRDLGAKLCQVNHPEHGLLKTKLYLPVLINKELRGYIKARLTKHADYPSYINASGPWSRTCGLFPFDYSVALMRKIKSHTLLLVEGPRDALRLLQEGIPAVCILGTQSWSPAKSRLLELADVSRLVTMMDGDDAGIAATEMLVKANSTMFDVVALKLWSIKGSPYIPFRDEPEPAKAAKAAGVDLWDPATVPQWVVNKVKHKYFS